MYLHAINIAGRADNHQLGTAIVSWVTAMRGATGTAAPGAPYATQECQRIGIALRFHPPGGGPNAGTSPVSSAPIAKPDGSDSSGSEGGGND